MQDAENDIEIGPGGWVLVAVAGAGTFAVLRFVLGYHLLSSAAFGVAIALIVLLLLYRLAAEISRQEAEENGSKRVRKIVPASGAADGGGRISGPEGAAVPSATAVRVMPERPTAAQASPPPSSVVTPLSEIAPAPLIAPPPVVAPKPKDEAKPAPVAEAQPQAAAKPKPEAKPKAKPKADAKAVGATPGWTTKPAAARPADAGPARLTAPRNGKADDLKLILGIGPKLEALCNRLGFYHFDQIAAWTPAEIAWVDDSLEGFKGRVSRDKWVVQAKVLAAGGTPEEAERAAKA
ncbi:hypothetical protein [Tabrizicola sp.]|uniref:hypothetical protein n=1 Tax=Tabrizicola sp. TaxID=2005166 RepID=UPI003F30EAD1